MTMFGHLRAEDFTNLLEGATLTGRRLIHLQSCPRCKEKFESVQAVRSRIEAMRMDSEEFIPEPDWSEFRSDVRNALLSRSVRRENTRRNWSFGIPLKPVMASGIAMLLILGLTITTSVLWDRNQKETDPTPVATVETFSADDANVYPLAVTSQMDVLDDLLQLNPEEVASLDMILDDLTQKGVSEQ